MGRPTKGGTPVQVRLPDEVLQEVDRAVEELRVQFPGMSGITRSDVIRDAVVKAMAERREARKGEP